MALSSEKALLRYSEAYQRLYNRKPRDLRTLENGWVIVNGARMRVTELDYLTAQLQTEYRQGLEQRRTVVQRLLKFFKQQ